MGRHGTRRAGKNIANNGLLTFLSANWQKKALQNRDLQVASDKLTQM
jgi:hypothetical protein